MYNTDNTCPAAAPTQARRAFTLIELLVVIAIISVLAAILFPVFAQAREKARQASCLSNLKQVGLGLMQYTQDYDETPPRTWHDRLGNWTSKVTWNQMLDSYIKSRDVYRCPSDTGDLDGPVSPYLDPAPADYPKPWRTSYIVNAQFGSVFRTVSLADVVRPASTVYLADGGVTGQTTAPWVTDRKKEQAWLLQDPTNSNNDSCCHWEVSNPANADWAAPGARHQNMANVAFLDGHVKSLRPEAWYFGNTPWLDYTRGGGGE